jgi:hypothetical protein
MLAQIKHHSQPFAFFTSDQALPPALLKPLLALFPEDLAWEAHDTFYKAYLCDITNRLPTAPCANLIQRMAAITGIPLTEEIRVTIQRMEPGQFASPHTDRPLLGYEAVRLIVQLNPNWQPGHGGELQLHPDESGAISTQSRPPVLNSAFGFVMGPQSFHSVRATTETRRTAVFNFWHKGNTPDLSRWTKIQFNGMRFDALPAALTQRAIDAEATHNEEDSFRAAAMAHLLQQWDFNSLWICQAYEAGLKPNFQPDEALPLALARWFVRLEFNEFCANEWRQIQERIVQNEWRFDPRLTEALVQAFPDFEKKAP